MDTDQDLHNRVARSEARHRSKTEWPWYGQLVIFAVLLLAIVVIFLVPSWLPEPTRPESITGYVAMTAVLISGTFLFMTFRMDRNATNEARTAVSAAVEDAKTAAIQSAIDKADRSAKSAVNDRLGEIVESIMLRNPHVLRQEMGAAIARLLPALARGATTEYMDEHLGEAVQGAIQSEEGRSLVLGAVRLAVGEQLEGALESVLPGQLNELLPGLVDERLPILVDERLNPEVLKQIVASDEIEEAIARRVEERLPAIVEEYFNTHRRRFWRR